MENNIEGEEFSLDYKTLNDLTYIDHKTHVELFHKNEKVANLEVWTDSESKNEYVIINYEIIYLHDIS